MKKVLFCLSLLINLSVLGAVPSFAMEFAFDPAYIGSLGDLGYGLAGGMHLDFDNTFIKDKYAGEFQQYQANGNFEGQRLVKTKAAYDFLVNYAISRGLPLPKDASDYVENLPTDTYSYFKSVYFDNQVRSISNKAKLAGDDQALLSDALRFGIGPSAFSDWAEYSQFWYNKYVEIGNSGTEDGPSIPDDIPATSQAFIDTCNGNDAYKFFWKNGLTNIPDPASPTDRIFYFTAPHSDRSWFRYSSGSGFDTLNYYNNGLRITGNYIYGSNSILTLNIVSGESTFTGTIDNITTGNLGYYGSNTGTNFYYFTAISDLTCSSLNNISALTQARYASTVNTSVTRTSASIDGLLEWFSARFRNININVDGVPWAIAGDAIDEAPADPLIPTFPDIIDSDSDDPAYWIDLPNTDTGEGYFDLTSLFDKLLDAIGGALDGDDSTDSTLDGDAITFEDEAGEAVDDDERADDDVIDDSIPDPTGFPNIPIPLPPIQDAFSGTTVLAELVHATDVVMPDELMAVFWGILFILFIIGLIKVLHK